ncbi:MAG: SprT-like domain-containing protein [Gammaproteobacteria bacterium]|nr:SprT-like domain-containing protein [Gammaproteobacteria bacterium]
MQYVEPIDAQLQNQVIALTQDYIRRAAGFYQREFTDIPIIFNLSGRIAGMYRVYRGDRLIRYNPYLFAKYYADNLARTVPHEVAHYITDMLYGIRKVKPHGREWQKVMNMFGVEPRVTCDYDLSGIPQRKQQRHDYRCACRHYSITTRRHNMIRKGERLYQCPTCRNIIEATRCAT